MSLRAKRSNLFEIIVASRDCRVGLRPPRNDFGDGRSPLPKSFSTLDDEVGSAPTKYMLRENPVNVAAVVTVSHVVPRPLLP
jgi:hypothetical protein